MAMNPEERLGMVVNHLEDMISRLRSKVPAEDYRHITKDQAAEQLTAAVYHITTAAKDLKR